MSYFSGYFLAWRLENAVRLGTNALDFNETWAYNEVLVQHDDAWPEWDTRLDGMLQEGLASVGESLFRRSGTFVPGYNQPQTFIRSAGALLLADATVGLHSFLNFFRGFLVNRHHFQSF